MNRIVAIVLLLAALSAFGGFLRLENARAEQEANTEAEIRSIHNFFTK